jgi:NAD+ synthase (glutamine-hydrolysing)
MIHPSCGNPLAFPFVTVDSQALPFQNLYRHGFARVAACVPSVRVADPEFNVEATIVLARRAGAESALVAVFPELGLSAYSCDDLFHQDALLDAVNSALTQLIDESTRLKLILVVGAPVRVGSQLFNCAITIHAGKVLAVTPKSFLPGYREFYEERQFSRAQDASVDETTVCGQTVPFGTNIVIEATNLSGFVLHTEICEDVWVPVPPSTWAALAGATLLTNLSGSPVTVGKAAYRRELCSAHSARCVSAYVYAGAGQGESTTDLAWDGHAIVTENGVLLGESVRFSAQPQIVLADIDLERLISERARLNSFSDAIADERDRARSIRRVKVILELPDAALPLSRRVDRFPFVPASEAERDERCSEVYDIQVQGLAQRLVSTGIKKVVIGVSGGLDSTQALLVCARVFDRLNIPRTNILAYTMPGFATSERTLNQANELMRVVGVTAETIDIRPSCRQMLDDLNHPFADGVPTYDITFENVQAGERTSHLFRLANHHGGLVVGTGDLSELALGWCTYGVGDQMSHYNVNSSVPKTLVQHLIRWMATQTGGETASVLTAIVETDISPELVPSSPNDGGTDPAHANQQAPSQRTEDKIGPYELQDFTLYYISRYGFRPSKVAFLALHAWHDSSTGIWPDLLATQDRHEYDLTQIRLWMKVFLSRFFGTSQFKRTAMPNGPKVGSGGSLSPRGDWRAPTDAAATVWLAELERNVPNA